ncbi:hypothetical protein [uncultured Kordia sp.]|uniref:hypothetical protein n=1 Tax=uncultured Kordia sp. TaxID=507699 RepID=UPI002619169F|nr:hypothetical protein [uncultured Kordia sp.]
MKKYIYIVAVSFFILVSCHSTDKNAKKNADKNTEKNAVLTSYTELASHVGQKVTILGEISNTKIPQIIGVDIDYDGDTAMPKTGKATGILIETVVPKDTSNIQKAWRGPGTFYHLQSLEGNTMAKVEIVHP